MAAFAGKYGLSARETEILTMLAAKNAEQTTQELADALGVSRRTCERRLSALYAKTGVAKQGRPDDRLRARNALTPRALPAGRRQKQKNKKYKLKNKREARASLFLFIRKTAAREIHRVPEARPPLRADGRAQRIITSIYIYK